MTRFRPCIDLHEGKVKQIVGGSLREGVAPQENFVSTHSAGWYSRLYREDGMTGGHVIMLGPGNEEAAREALAEWPGGWQLGGGITAANAVAWLEAGAGQVIVTSWLFSGEGRFLPERLESLSRLIGAGRLVVDLSCRRTTDGWAVAMNRWQTPTDLVLSAEMMGRLSPHCCEFLVHAADVEGKCGGMDEDLVGALAAWSPLPVTYAGGARSIADLARVESLSGGRVDVTIGSALDLFGGSLVRYEDCLAWNRVRPVVS